jgi:hypothetical protein
MPEFFLHGRTLEPMAVLIVEFDAPAIFHCDGPLAASFDLVNPVTPGGKLRHCLGNHGTNKAGDRLAFS